MSALLWLLLACAGQTADDSGRGGPDTATEPQGTDTGSTDTGSTDTESGDTECEADELECRGACRPCPDGAEQVACDWDTCVAATCEQGYERCDGQCERIPEGALAWSCNGDTLDVSSCERGYALAEGLCTCPAPSTGLAAPGTLAAASEPITKSWTGCHTGVEGAAARLCMTGDHLIRVRYADAHDLDFEMAEVVVRDDSCATTVSPNCSVGVHTADWRAVVRYIPEGRCLLLEGTSTRTVGDELYFDVYGPLGQSASVVELTVDGQGVVHFPAEMAFDRLQFRRDGQPLIEDEITLTVTLPTGESRSRSQQWGAGQTNVTVTTAWDHSSSTWRLTGLDNSPALRVWAMDVRYLE